MRRRYLFCRLWSVVLVVASLSLVFSTGDETILDTELPAELTAGNFTTYFSTLPTDSWVLVEFYADWCPHCQHFKPIYEKVSQYFAQNTKYGINVARVECGNQGPVCNRFKISGYPSLRLGRPDHFAKEELSQLLDFDGRRTADGVISWVGTKLNSTLDLLLLESKPHPGGSVKSSPNPPPAVTSAARNVSEEFDLRDVELATVLATKYLLQSYALLVGTQKRQALADFVALLAAAHPSRRCRNGASSIHRNFAKLWPAEKAGSGPSEKLLKVAICGKNTAKMQEGEWHSCKGSVPDSRGFTCGLWLLLHSLAAGVPQDMGGALWATGVHGYVANFFQCKLCAEHFVAMADELHMKAVRSRSDGMLWMWRAHNKVNKRLESIEVQWGHKDPQFPKQQWPSAQACPSCRQEGGEWDEQAVLHFLERHYGRAAAHSRARKMGGSGLALARQGAALLTRQVWGYRLGMAGLLILVIVAVSFRRTSKRQSANGLLMAHTLPTWQSMHDIAALRTAKSA